MISKSFGLLFYLKKPRSESQKERSIFLRITKDLRNTTVESADILIFMYVGY